jgi:hypothetical protein
VKLIFALLVLSIAPVDPITIDTQPPTTRQVIVENPATMPSHHGGEDAWCRFFFNCSVHLKYEIVEQSRRDGRTIVTTQIQQVKVTLTLEDTIFLPRHGTEKLKAHEEGHRRINERVYQSAEDAARNAAREIMAKRWEGAGVDEDAAGKTATDKAVKELCDEYLTATAEKALRIGKTYDELTNHGKRMRPSENDAIDRAFAAESSSK